MRNKFISLAFLSAVSFSFYLQAEVRSESYDKAISVSKSCADNESDADGMIDCIFRSSTKGKTMPIELSSIVNSLGRVAEGENPDPIAEIFTNKFNYNSDEDLIVSKRPYEPEIKRNDNEDTAVAILKLIENRV
jgi:hypothetical protein